MRGPPFLAAFGLLLQLCAVLGVPESGTTTLRCNLPAKTDRVIGYTDKYGFKDPSDVIWFNQEWAFRTYGPLSQLTMYKAWYYDGAWHNPGEFKGLQTWYGHGAEQSNLLQDELLIGARRPHVPQTFQLYREEVLVRAEFQWDHIMRWMNFTTNLGRYFAWGFPNVEGTKTEIQEAPLPGAYIAAFRGWEGKPLPPERGGYKKRYISQIGIVWAQRECDGITPFKPKFGKPATPGKPAGGTQTESATKAVFLVANTQQPKVDARPQATARYALTPTVDTTAGPPPDSVPAPVPATQAPADWTAPQPADAAPSQGSAPAADPAPGSATSGQVAGDARGAASATPLPSGNRRLQLRL